MKLLIVSMLMTMFLFSACSSLEESKEDNERIRPEPTHR